MTVNPFIRAVAPAVAIVMLAAAPVGSDAASKHGAASRHRYCADRGAVFKGSRRMIGIYVPLDDRGPRDMECTTGRVAADGIGFVRDELDWALVQRRRRRYNWGWYDQKMEALAAHRLTWLPVLEQAPRFRTRVRGHGLAPPASARAYAAFLKLCVRRYGPHGTFWREHPTLPYLPVRAWQIWNEPSLAAYWLPSPSPRGYTALLRASYRAIKSVDPHATVVAAGVPFYAGVQFYQRVYRDGGRRYFDVMAFHPYSGGLKFAEEDISLLRSVMNRAGDRRKPIWITEFGWASGGPRSPFRAGSRTPDYVSRLLAFMLGHRDLGIQRISYYDWRDPPKRPVDWWGLHMGIYRQNGTPRPVASVVISAARKLDH